MRKKIVGFLILIFVLIGCVNFNTKDFVKEQLNIVKSSIIEIEKVCEIEVIGNIYNYNDFKRIMKELKDSECAREIFIKNEIFYIFKNMKDEI